MMPWEARSGRQIGAAFVGLAQGVAEMVYVRRANTSVMRIAYLKAHAVSESSSLHDPSKVYVR